MKESANTDRVQRDNDTAHHSSIVIQHTYGADAEQFGTLYVPDAPGPHPVVVLIHGGFWREKYSLTLMIDLAESLVKTGHAVWNIEYRRVGHNGGGWPGTLQDVARATDLLTDLAERYELDLQHVIAIGHSAGGHLALWLAGRHNIPATSPLATTATSALKLCGIISLAGVSDLKQAWRFDLGQGATTAFVGGSPSEYHERYASASPASLLPLDTPQVLVHGSADMNVPLKVSQSYAQKARKAGDEVKLIELKDVDHFALINPNSEAWAITYTEIQRLLGISGDGLKQ